MSLRQGSDHKRRRRPSGGRSSIRMVQPGTDAAALPLVARGFLDQLHRLWRALAPPRGDPWPGTAHPAAAVRGEPSCSPRSPFSNTIFRAHGEDGGPRGHRGRRGGSAGDRRRRTRTHGARQARRHGERRRRRAAEEPAVAQGLALKPLAQPGRPRQMTTAEGSLHSRRDHRTARTWELPSPEARAGRARAGR